MAPLVGAHQLVVHVRRQHRRSLRALQGVVEPVIANVVQLDHRARIEREPVNRRRGPVLSALLVIRADQQRMICPRVVLVMLVEVIERARLPGRVIAGHREHRNIYVGKFFAERRELLPEPVVARVAEPAAEGHAALPGQRGELAVTPPAFVPVFVERSPAGIVAGDFVVGRRRNAVHPSVSGVQEDPTGHWQVNAGRHGVRGGNRLQCRGHVFRCGPGDVAAVAAALHAHAAVAPGLFRDPLDDCACIVTV